MKEILRDEMVAAGAVNYLDVFTEFDETYDNTPRMHGVKIVQALKGARGKFKTR